VRPYDTNAYGEISAMLSDNFGGATQWSILNCDDHVSLHPPARVHEETKLAFIRIPKDEFRAIVDWFMAEQEPNQ
jgi:hypothetical protein